jgi:aminoglycoside phosphotransferase (APT) family kinase protein
VKSDAYAVRRVGVHCHIVSVMTREVGPLLASGRDGDIFEYGPGLVIRKARDGRSLEHEARVMGYVAQHGYAVPAVEEVRASGTEIVMERIDGPMMMDVMAKKPWTMPRHASMLADLHDALHAIPAPDWVPQLADDGKCLVHLDLHPMNVMLSARGPVVIDWTNASRGQALSDISLTYVLLTCPQMPAPRAIQVLARPAREFLARTFARRYRGPAFDARLALAAEMKALDPNMLPAEVAACRRLAVRAGRKAEG